MLTTLLESRAARQRRGGGAAMSAAVHLAIIGGVAATTTHVTRPKIETDKPTEVRYVTPTAPTPVARVSSLATTRSSMPTLRLPQTPTIAVPTTIPTSLPPIDLSRGLTAADFDNVRIVRGGGGRAHGLLDGADSMAQSNDWSGNEVLMHILQPAQPRYPEALRRAGVSGRVLIRFTVDTTGRVDMRSVQILSATHELFADAVRVALPNFRFRPAEVGSRKVPALAEMPFEFDVR